MTSKFYTIPIIVAGVAWAFSGCSADQGSNLRQAGLCNAEAALRLVGKQKPTDEDAARLTGSRTVRQIQSGDVVSQDFRVDRVTIETDPVSGRVVAASCV